MTDFTSTATGLFPPLTRRAAIGRMAGGAGAIALASMLDSSGAVASPTPNALAAKTGHHTAKAKRVIFLFMYGGPSAVDTFDYKPELQKRG